MPKQMPPWATKIIAAVLIAAAYVIHHPGLLPDDFHGISVKGACSSLIGVFMALGISGPALWPQLAAFLGNPGAAQIAAAKGTVASLDQLPKP